MTSRQLYSELAKVAGVKCDNGESFLHCESLTARDAKEVQRKLIVLMEKCDYDRTHRDFSRGVRVAQTFFDESLARGAAVLEEGMIVSPAMYEMYTRSIGMLRVDSIPPQRT